MEYLVVGGSLIALGHFSLALEGVASFYTGLGLLIIGTGFFKPNVSTMVGQLYETHDPRRGVKSDHCFNPRPPN